MGCGMKKQSTYYKIKTKPHLPAGWIEQSKKGKILEETGGSIKYYIFRYIISES